MAKAKVESAGVVVTLKLSEDEALYVHWALVYSTPAKLLEDTVFDALEGALAEAHVDFGESLDHLAR